MLGGELFGDIQVVGSGSGVGLRVPNRDFDFVAYAQFPSMCAVSARELRHDDFRVRPRSDAQGDLIPVYGNDPPRRPARCLVSDRHVWCVLISVCGMAPKATTDDPNRLFAICPDGRDGSDDRSDCAIPYAGPEVCSVHFRSLTVSLSAKHHEECKTDHRTSRCDSYH